MRTSGLVLDFYDDRDAQTFQSMYPTRESVPALVKTAHVLSSVEQERLPDDVFALVLAGDEGDVLRKFACIDAGNTSLSVDYFLATGHKLPQEAQKVAAANLCTACEWYALPTPEVLTKVALGLGTLMTGMNVASGVAGINSGIKKGITATKAQQGMVTPGISKMADVTGTYLMPNSQPSQYPATSKAVVKKLAAIGHLVQGEHAKHPASEKGETLAQNKPVDGKAPAPKQMHPHVNTCGSEPITCVRQKTACYTALPGKYPLDSYAQVKEACAYFDTYGMHFDPEDRREYCANLVKRAGALGIVPSDVIRRYGSSTYAPVEEVKIALDARRLLVKTAEQKDAFTKLAQAQPTLSPDLFARTLEELDKLAGIHIHYDSDIPDAFYSTFGFVKEATFTEVIGNDYVNEFMLKQVATSEFDSIKERFGEDVAEEFRKDPVGIFQSLPREQKQIIMRLAASTSPSRDL